MNDTQWFGVIYKAWCQLKMFVKPGIPWWKLWKKMHQNISHSLSSVVLTIYMILMVIYVYIYSGLVITQSNMTCYSMQHCIIYIYIYIYMTISEQHCPVGGWNKCGHNSGRVFSKVIYNLVIPKPWHDIWRIMCVLEWRTACALTKSLFCVFPELQNKRETLELAHNSLSHISFYFLHMPRL